MHAYTYHMHSMLQIYNMGTDGLGAMYTLNPEILGVRTC